MRSLKMIDRYEVQERLQTKIGDYLKGENAILVDLNFRPQRGKFILRILVDEPSGGITLDRCGYFNKAIGQLLDREGLIPGNYILEISSPGIDRSLVTRGDFSRCLNRKVRIFLDSGQDQEYEILGRIASVTETAVNVNLGHGIQQIQFDRIRKAKQVIE